PLISTQNKETLCVSTVFFCFDLKQRIRTGEVALPKGRRSHEAEGCLQRIPLSPPEKSTSQEVLFSVKSTPSVWNKSSSMMKSLRDEICLSAGILWI
ncbi:MAG: hypothetical protein IKM38_00525, partial [Christensenellaceae bacterium]|nr:hypothetical protein [Christensenellaceae bacterium]